jgi:hypothetical protein
VTSRAGTFGEGAVRSRRLAFRSEVPAERIAVIVSAWLAELGATCPLVQELACAMRSGDWPNAHALAECLSVEVAVAV